MRITQQAKSILKYLPVLAVLAVTLMGLFMGKDLYRISLDSGSKTPTLLSAEPNSPQPPIVLEAAGPCDLAHIYTSLPPKCKTTDGKFIPVPGTSNILVIPEGK
jgi:hypothetical protein